MDDWCSERFYRLYKKQHKNVIRNYREIFRNNRRNQGFIHVLVKHFLKILAFLHVFQVRRGQTDFERNKLMIKKIIKENVPYPLL